MSSSCYFQFKSQKEPTRVTFDGTGISVFELKREIINISKLGDGSDFDLSIYNKDTNEGEYLHGGKCNFESELIFAQQNMMMIPLSYLDPHPSSLVDYLHPSQVKAEQLVMFPDVCQSPQRTHIARKHIHPVRPRARPQQMHMAQQLWTKLSPRRRESPQCSRWAQTNGKNKNSIWQGMLDCAVRIITTANIWCRQQAIYRPGGGAAKKPGPDPDQPLPSEYVCYRCGVKGEGLPSSLAYK